jgi:hypothetical protein
LPSPLADGRQGKTATHHPAKNSLNRFLCEFFDKNISRFFAIHAVGFKNGNQSICEISAMKIPVIIENFSPIN